MINVKEVREMTQEGARKSPEEKYGEYVDDYATRLARSIRERAALGKTSAHVVLRPTEVLDRFDHSIICQLLRKRFVGFTIGSHWYDRNDHTTFEVKW